MKSLEKISKAGMIAGAMTTLIGAALLFVDEKNNITNSQQNYTHAFYGMSGLILYALSFFLYSLNLITESTKYFDRGKEKE